MGFSEIAVTVILFSTFLFVGGIIAAAWISYHNLVDNAVVSQGKLLEEKVHTNFTITSVTKITGYLIINATNTGSVTIDLRYTSILIDGTLYGNVTDYTYYVQGLNNTKYWFPSEYLVVYIPWTGPLPSRVSLVAQDGVEAYWG